MLEDNKFSDLESKEDAQPVSEGTKDIALDQPRMSINPNIGDQNQVVHPNTSLSQLFTPEAPADPMWPNKGYESEPSSQGENGQVYPKLPVYKPEERALLADLRGDKLSAADNFRNAEDKYQKANDTAKENLKEEVDIAKDVTGKASQKFLDKFGETDRGKEFNRLHQEALDEDKRRTQQQRGAQQNQPPQQNQRRPNPLLGRPVQGVDQDETLLLQEQARQLAAERTRQAQITNRYKRTLLAALTVLGIGAGVAGSVNAIRGNLKTIPAIERYLNNDDGDPRPSSLNQALSIPNDFEVIEYEVSPDWYLGPDFIEDEENGDTRWLIHTQFGDVETGSIIEYTDNEDYFMFNLPNGEAYALKITYGIDPRNPDQGQMSIVKISQKGN